MLLTMDMGLQLIKINIIPNPKKNQILLKKRKAQIIHIKDQVHLKHILRIQQIDFKLLFLL